MTQRGDSVGGVSIPVEEPFGRVGGAAEEAEAAVWGVRGTPSVGGEGRRAASGFICACAYLSADPASRARMLCARRSPRWPAVLRVRSERSAEGGSWRTSGGRP